MKKLLVLGGTGFLGYYTVLDALKKGYDVTTLGIDTSNLMAGSLKKSMSESLMSSQPPKKN